MRNPFKKPKEKKPKKRMVWLDRTLIRSHLHIGIAFHGKEVKHEMKRLRIDKSMIHQVYHDNWTHTDADATTIFLDNAQAREHLAIVLVHKRCPTKPHLIGGVLAHEATHIWQAIKETMGEEAPGHEMEAYAIQSITTKLLHAYYERNPL